MPFQKEEMFLIHIIIIIILLKKLGLYKKIRVLKAFQKIFYYMAVKRLRLKKTSECRKISKPLHIPTTG